MSSSCELCVAANEDVVVSTPLLRVILVDDDNYPGFCRVIWHAHVKEMTDLAIANRSAMMQAVCKVEEAIRDVMQPDKINLASLGNMVPHLHWHVIPRYRDDAHFPSPIWASTERSSQNLAAKRALLPELRRQIEAMFA
ncbi:HIT family protein [Undibacterium cyanobacteriorum]|uniref:HIT family protein n=1 Tax=Undibacterium cyanobacteriorum TaxID=3073561 RepID=A0ABY9RKL4_9BURK|nr:HIT family protein [Undibacterium sp. 20NA77.5]WMW81496.1 HIT family protein [Undibacterium sp. 20NA77.5]